MISDAMNKGCRNFTIGLGGSATNDGGCGMLSALGFAQTAVAIVCRLEGRDFWTFVA